MLLVKLPLFGALGMVVDLRLLDLLGLEGSDHVEGVFEVGHLADRVLEAGDVDQLLHPGGPASLEDGEEALLRHAHRHLAEDQGHLLRLLLLELVLSHPQYLAALADNFLLRGGDKVEVGKGGRYLVSEPQENRVLAPVVNLPGLLELDPGILLKPVLEVFLKLNHVCTQVDVPLHVVQQQLHDALPLGIHLAPLHLLGFHPVSGQVGRVDDRAGHPLERGLEGLATLRD